MRVGLFTDTYFPQVSGVATSIRTLKEALEAKGHEVYIFTGTDKGVKRYEDPTIIRLPSVPFVSFTDRRVVYRGVVTAYKIAKEYQLDIIHTQTEFSLGLLGKWVGAALHIPVVHTYHTQYEDYVDYIAKGRLIRPSMVKYIMRGYLNDLDGVICPSRIVLSLLDGYGVTIPKRVIPTGIPLEDFACEEVTDTDIAKVRADLGIADDETMLLSLSRISSEKNIQGVLSALPQVLAENDKVKLIIVGDGPYLSELKKQTQKLEIDNAVIFTGMIPHDYTKVYYKAADFFVSASTSETQGLTYIESLAMGTPIIAHGNPYLDDLITNRMFGNLFYHDKDLADTILDAIALTPDLTPDQLDRKRYEVSAGHFAKSIHEFYLDVLISHSTQRSSKFSLTVKGSPTDRSVRLVKSAVRLPKKAAQTTVRTSRKVVKAPRKMVKSIWDFLNE
ncbi:glycosyltransferase family 4 protein [Streptococcus dentapri]|uniref:Glycosyltransferase family 4 protein n=1 Tax=Streptococcus dentapri TaxID=573564 RepID=A0ABV8CZB1_9STRE